MIMNKEKMKEKKMSYLVENSSHSIELLQRIYQVD